MRNLTISIAAALLIAFLLAWGGLDLTGKEETETGSEKCAKEICGTIERGETFFDIFKRHNLDVAELFELREASANTHRLRKVSPGRPYRIVLDENDRVDSLVYWPDDDSILNITRGAAGFNAELSSVEYEKAILHTGGSIRENLVSSLGTGSEDLKLALDLSDIFSWDIDFTTDLRRGDTFKVVVEGYYRDEEFRKYGEILSAEFVNNGETHRAYRFEIDGKVDYFDEEGKALRKAFLKAPLSFRRISSGFSRGRFHPVLRIYRPHHGIDYAAPAGTPVSASGDGTVVFSGYKGQYGKLVILRHPNGYTTHYGHLSRIGKGISKGKKIEQGQIIGYVGATGLATGPHLHYEMRRGGRAINPLDLRIPREKTVPVNAMAEFRKLKDEMNNRLAATASPAVASVGQSSRRVL